MLIKPKKNGETHPKFEIYFSLLDSGFWVAPIFDYKRNVAFLNPNFLIIVNFHKSKNLFN